MTINQYAYEDYRVIESNFLSLNELLAHLAHAEINQRVFTRLSSDNGTYKFTKTHSFAEAVAICSSGYQEGFDNFLRLKEELNTHMPTVAYRRYPISDVAGFTPNIGAYLSGSPKSMYRLAPQEENKFLTIYFNCSYDRTTKHGQILHKGIITLELIQLLERIGYRVDLRFFELSVCGKEITFTNIKLKDAGEPVDIKTCYFPMCHPSFLRRIMFRQLEVTQGIASAWSIGYGKPMGKENIGKFIAYTAQEPSYILINTPDDMGVRGIDLITDANQLLDSIQIAGYIEVANKDGLIFNSRSEIGAFSRFFQ